MIIEDEILRKDLFDFDISGGRDSIMQAYTDQATWLKLRIDWWSKYYYSIGEKFRAPGYEEFVFTFAFNFFNFGDFRSGMDTLVIFSQALEDVEEYEGFEDFLDTFVFRKPTKKNLNDDSGTNKSEARGQLKGKFFIYPTSKSKEREYF